ncbi:MAG: ribonuclease HII [Candidatus Micrarchaeota archaeon]|nr:ribonuclease HII [Candidatus Micrarchaeota archaeon]MDE1847404.1 ribonuclease HII [Candidatus Micrarchaeota archaeon]MDE1864101.1 ribonuclease HII [Candidatus Micrarchaeota archaeon]
MTESPFDGGLIIIAGGDEAGRGAVIGPLVIGVVSIKQGRGKKLSKIGVRDSKLLTPKKREFLYDEILSLAEEAKNYAISPLEINNAMRSNISLNELEAICISRLIDSLDQVDEIYLDSPDVVPERFGLRISVLSKKPMKVHGVKAQKMQNAIKVVSEHKADVKYPVVSAASIVAKVVRDREMEKISDSLGIDMGSGYASDNQTISMIKQNLNNPGLIPYIREYWKTMTGIRQLKIDEFMPE